MCIVRFTLCFDTGQCRLLNRNIYIILIYMSLQLILVPFYIIWFGKHTIAISTKLELYQYVIGGMLYTFILVVFLLKRRAITSNYKFIETDFRHWSIKKGTDQNHTYENNLRKVKILTKPFIVTICFIISGPLMSTLYDLGMKPIDHNSHFLLFWPKVSINYSLIIHTHNNV